MLTTQLVESCRAQFPALAREVGGQPAAFFDGPAGTQVPMRVADAVRAYLLNSNANHGGRFATARESDRMLADAPENALLMYLRARIDRDPVKDMELMQKAIAADPDFAYPLYSVGY